MLKLELRKKRVLIVGLGMSGRSAAQFLIFHGAIVYGADRKFESLTSEPEIQALQRKGLCVQSDKDIQNINTFDLIIVSPGIPPCHPLLKEAHDAYLPVIGEIELGCRFTKNPMFGITGTNGKTTVTLLVAYILNQSGIQARALGNVEIPFTHELLNISSEVILTLELSSYQIETLYQPCLAGGILLNITPDHLDRYHSMEAYAQVKCDLERCLKPDAPLYMEERAWRQYGHLLKKKKPLLYGYEKTSFIYTDLQAVYRAGKKEFELPPSFHNQKSHDLENLLAAYALCADHGVSNLAFLDAWKSFKKPAHRIEFVSECQGVRYYDDSKGTNIDAVIRAVESLEGPIILIAGGVDKGFPYSTWLEGFKNKVKLICAIGQAAAKIGEQLSSSIPFGMFDSLEEAVQQASRMAQKGDNVLLSPGCSSFDMFKDYAHRGEEFQRIVRELVKSVQKEIR